MAVKTDSTPEQIAIEKTEKARKAADERNQSRVDKLNAIADNNDNAKNNGMVDTDGEQLVLQDEEDNKLKAEEALRASEEAAAAEAAAKALQEEGAPEKVDEPALVEAKTDEDPNSKDVDGVKHYRTTINGKEKWLTLDQLIATSQKVEAADEYLAEAKAKAEKTPTAVEVPKEPETKVETPDWAKTLHDAVMGDEEAIKKVASALESRPSEMTPDVVRQIDDRWSFRRAAEWFEDNYSDLLGDPRLKRLVYEEDAELAQANPKMPYKQRLKTAGDAIRGAVSGWTKAPTKVEAKTSSAKVEAKRSLPSVPAAASRQPVVTEDEPEESVEQSIAKMAQARGQARAIVHRSTTR